MLPQDFFFTLFSWERIEKKPEVESDDFLGFCLPVLSRGVAQGTQSNISHKILDSSRVPLSVDKRQTYLA